MKLVYLASSTLPSTGADAVHVMNMCKAFTSIGVDVTLIARKSKENKTIKQVFEYYGFPENLFNIILVDRPEIRKIGGFIYGHNVAKAFNKLEKPDIIYARSMHALAKIDKKHTPFFFESHWLPTNKLYFYWQKKWLKHPKLVSFILISNGLKKLYSDIFHNHLDKLHILHDACNIPEAQKIPKENKRLQVGYVGSFFKGNGYEIIPDLAKLMPDIDFHIIGGKEPLLSELKHKYNNQNNLIFHGHIPHGKLIKLYYQLDIMLAPYQKSLPHLQWVSPMKLFEYMSFSKPIIASDFPVIREVLNEDNSILVQAENIEQWIQAINKLKDKQLREKIGKKAYQDFANNYTWKKRAEEIIKLYNEKVKKS